MGRTKQTARIVQTRAFVPWRSKDYYTNKINQGNAHFRHANDTRLSHTRRKAHHKLGEDIVRTLFPERRFFV
jgi:hypothetical protein